MANEETAFREVDQALADQEQWDFFRKNGPLLIGGALALVLGVGAWQFYGAQKQAAAEKGAIAFNEAAKSLSTDPDAGKEALAKVAESAPAGYAALATMTRAGALAQTGDAEGALAAYRALYKGEAPKRMKELARLRAAMLAMPDRDAVLADLGELADAPSTLGYYARELAGLAALEAKDYEGALAMFDKAADDVAAPEPIRQRADEFAALALAAKSGVNITGAVTAGDLLKSLDGETADAHAGHDHGPETPEAPPQQDPPQ